MAIAPSNLLPTVQLRCELAQRKAKHISFDEAWDECLSKINWPPDRQSRVEWQVSITQTKAGWKAAYCDEGIVIELDLLIGSIAA